MTRTGFLGTPASAVPALHALEAISDLEIVLTRPDRPGRRGRRLEPSPVKAAAAELGLATVDADRKSDVVDALGGRDLDIVVVAAFGVIIPAEALAMPRRGMVNVHYSILPRWRGAAPVERAILAGDTSTGVTLMQMDEGLDTGPVHRAWVTAIGAEETAGDMTARLAVAGGELLAVGLPSVVDGTSIPRPQAEKRSTYAHMVDEAEARLDFRRSAVELDRTIRAFNPRPGAHARRDGERFKVHRARPLAGEIAPGHLELEEGRLVVGTSHGILELVEVQPGGSRRMSGPAWARGVRGPLGRLE